jgi:hypothetical protein
MIDSESHPHNNAAHEVYGGPRDNPVYHVPIILRLSYDAQDDPTKFRKSKSVGAFLGLTTRSYQSGEIDGQKSIARLRLIPRQ